MTAGTRIRRRPPGPPGRWPDAIPGLLRRVYCARGAHDADAAQPRLANLLPPDTLSGIDAAVALLAEAIAGDIAAFFAETR